MKVFRCCTALENDSAIVNGRVPAVTIAASVDEY